MRLTGAASSGISRWVAVNSSAESAPALGLPAFESLLGARALATEGTAARLAATASGAPLRAAFVYFPNGAIPSAWWPTGNGADFEPGAR